MAVRRHIIVAYLIIYKTTMTSFAITLYGQCCRCHVVGQPVVRDINLVRSR